MHSNNAPGTLFDLEFLFFQIIYGPGPYGQRAKISKRCTKGYLEYTMQKEKSKVNQLDVGNKEAQHKHW